MRIRTLTLLVAMFFIGVMPVAQSDGNDMECARSQKPGITEISEVPWQPPPPGVYPKVIYGDDDRIDVYQETDPQRLAWTNATCALINESRLTQHADGSWEITSLGAFRRFNMEPCEHEPFADQPVAASCTGFMVGDDIIVTAGHCYSSTSLESIRFVFGFWMLDATTPRFHFDESEVYYGVEIISRAGSGNEDHAVVRVDRPITAPGAHPLEMRTTDSIQPGEFVGVIGHPSGMPMKLAFGNTYVRSSSHSAYFVANLDTYGGNSGSPVFNQQTGLVEGILVRGATDFVRNYEDNCFESNVYGNDEGRGEDVTKTTVFVLEVPGYETYTGSVDIDSAYYQCEDVMEVVVLDEDLLEENEIAVTIETTAGDSETLVLAAESPGAFIGNIALQPGTPAPDSGVLEVEHGDTITVFYEDEMDETGMPATHTATAEVDCYPPQILDVSLSYIGATQLRITATTDDVATVTVFYGLSCADLDYMASSTWGTEHSIHLSGLTEETVYYFSVVAFDRAGNETYSDNDGACYTFHTYGDLEYFTEHFTITNPLDLDYRQVTFTPVDTPNYYQACISDAAELPAAPGGTSLSLDDDGYIEIPFTHGAPIAFYGDAYDSMFIGSNGYITFGTGDTAFQPMYSLHFQLPRISGLFCDLNPEMGGEVYVARVQDRYVTTFVDVPVYSSSGDYGPENRHTFQMELFFCGTIRITWLELYSIRAVVGLSAGLGIPHGFSSIDFTALIDCGNLDYDGDHHSADSNEDWRISLEELLRVVQFYNAGEYHCDPTTDDGYAPGAGARDCTPHDSDYAPNDWRISLSELLRLVQLYNAGSYRPDNATEDGFRPFP